jgi:hypothetical protein
VRHPPHAQPLRYSNTFVFPIVMNIKLLLSCETAALKSSPTMQCQVGPYFSSNFFCKRGSGSIESGTLQLGDPDTLVMKYEIGALTNLDAGRNDFVIFVAQCI